MPDFDARRLDPGATFSYTDGDGSTHSMKADDQGIVRPKNAAAAAALAAHGATVVASERTAREPRAPRVPRVARVPRAPRRSVAETTTTPIEAEPATTSASGEET